MSKTRFTFAAALSAITAAGAAAALAIPAHAAPGPNNTDDLTPARAEIIRSAFADKKAPPKSAMRSALAAPPADITPTQIGFAHDRVYGRAPDGKIWWRPTGAGGAWKPFSTSVSSGPATIDASDEEGVAVALFARGNAGDLVWNLQKDGAPDDVWLPLGGKLSSAPSATIDGEGLHVAARGNDSAIWITTLDWATGGWRPWRSLGGRSSSAPSIAFHPVAGVLVTTRGTDGNVFQRRADSGEWIQLAMDPINSRPELNVDDDQVTPVMSYGWRGYDNALYLSTQDQDTVRAGGTLGSGATIYASQVTGTYNRETYVRGTDSAIWRYLDNGTTVPGRWERLGGRLS